MMMIIINDKHDHNGGEFFRDVADRWKCIPFIPIAIIIGDSLLKNLLAGHICIPNRLNIGLYW